MTLGFGTLLLPFFLIALGVWAAFALITRAIAWLYPIPDPSDETQDDFTLAIMRDSARMERMGE